MRPSVPWLATILVVAICTAIAGSANAQYPYSAGYALGGYPAGQVSPGLSTGFSPTTYVPATATVPGTTFVAGPTYAAGYAPAASTFIDPVASAPLVANGTYQAQRPAYFDNPSVYSGLPTLGYNSGYQSLRAPLTDSLRGSAVAAGAVEGYPTTYLSAYDGSLPGAPMTVTTPTGAPVTSIPATTVTPIYPAAPPQSECCLSRFFRKLCGTSYSTSYYRAPVTYYRPVTSVNVATGTPVVVQQPCTSYEQQVQRIPSTSLQFGSPAASTAPAPCPQSCPTSPNDCPPAGYGYGTNVASPSDQFGGVGQVGGFGGTGDVTNIPSIAPVSPSSVQPASPSGGTTWAPNTAPLTGAPTNSPPGGAGGDLAPVGQPSLNGAGTPSIPPGGSGSSPGQGPQPNWQLQNPQDSTALIRPRVTLPPTIDTNQTEASRTPLSPPPLPSSQTPPSLPRQILENDNFTRAEPIEAPDDYVAPYRRQSYQQPRTTPVTHGGMPHEGSGRSFREESNLTSVSTRVPALLNGSSSLVIRQP